MYENGKFGFFVTTSLFMILLLRFLYRLCTFQREIITEHDYKTLADEEYLNDNIVNFYLTWLHEKLSDEHKSVIHIYSR